MIRVRQVKVKLLEDSEEKRLEYISKRLKVDKKLIKKYTINKKSIDAREKSNILVVYEFDVLIEEESKVLKKLKDKDIFLTPSLEYVVPKMGEIKLKKRVLIVGSGPAGLFCAYMLALEGYKPIIVERGEKIEDRIKTVEKFFVTNDLNSNSNVQFGEGGAGTFSDGKLNTLTKDKFNRGRKVFEILVEHGAPKEILYLNKPHVGTDKLREVVKSMRKKIISLGGEFRYNSQVTDFLIEDNKIIGVTINDSYVIETDILVLAIGHSARDTFYKLYERGIAMGPKNFAVGVRVVHSQEMINKSQYGDNYKLLKAASYKLTHQTRNNRGVYSFCMCPGGFVVNASSEQGKIAVNGMSNYERNEKTANSAIVVTINKDDYCFTDNPLAGIDFQRKLEEKAFLLGKGLIPLQLYGDYLLNRESTSLGSFEPGVLGKYNFSNLNLLFPDFINEALKEGIEAFSKKISGFNNYDTVLLGGESRTSSPVIIYRDEDFVSNILGIYPCGEGAGYAGGITTSAIDGIKVFESIVKKYQA